MLRKLAIATATVLFWAVVLGVVGLLVFALDGLGYK